MRRRRQLTTTRPGSPNRYENFTVRGHRFRRSLGTDDEETAEILAAKIRADALLGAATGKRPEYTLSQALGRYLSEHGQFLATADDIARIGKTLLAGIGKATLLSEIAPDTLATFIARRRARVSNRSVNIEIEHLRAVLNRAGVLWGVAVPVPALPWKALLLDESGEREHVLSEAEEERLFAALRPDFHGIVRFALLTGLRLANVIELSWRQVDWNARAIVFRVKSRRPDGDLHYVPITAGVAAILSLERGRHKDRVFTYVCERNRFDPRGGTHQRKGRRYPFTHDGWRNAWKSALDAAQISDFRFHDLRHTAATRALAAHRDLAAVRRMLGHKAIATTLRYTRTNLDDVRAAMEAVETQGGRRSSGSTTKTSGSLNA